MGKDTGFIEFEKQAVPRREIQERVQDFREYDLNYSDNDIRQQASRCMDCGIPFCHMGCPLGNMIPDWNDLVYRDQWQDALGALHSTNNFPEFTGRICPAPCEDSCVLNEHYTLDPEEKIKKKIDVLLEINTSGETQKKGFSVEDSNEIFQCFEIQNVQVVGLMTMAPFTKDEKKIRSCFSLLRNMKNNLNKSLPLNSLKELSMGMSNDYEIAIEEGATQVRLGTVLFGPRN